MCEGQHSGSLTDPRAGITSSQHFCSRLHRWVLGDGVQIFILVWQALFQLSYLPDFLLLSTMADVILAQKMPFYDNKNKEIKSALWLVYLAKEGRSSVKTACKTLELRSH